MNVFWNAEENRLRALWRLLAQVLLTIVLGALPILLVAEPLTWLHRRAVFLPGLSKAVYDPVVNMIVGPLVTLAVIASVALGRRWIDKRGWDAYGVCFDARGWAALPAGFGLGVLLMSAIFAVELAFGWVEVRGFLAQNAGIPLALGLSFTLVKDLCVGVYEELISRGFLLRNLSDGLGPVWGVVVSSSIFAVLHAFNPNASVQGMVGIFMAGLLLAAARLRTGRLSAAVGLHIAWNLCQGAVFGFAVSGDPEPASLIAIVQRGPEVWTGGAFGPEAGLLGIAACLVGIALLFLLPRYPEPTGGTDAEADLSRARLLGDDRGSAADPDRPLPDREPQG
ncbi:MAG TPA: type II CAAX endopeptidase family protein [Candidatus Polarisedimenticolaceae bacterium]|nr:type II CAAX endopeptidase family protein [Candidatus Polarisedimenticolaceae bacterium]